MVVSKEWMDYMYPKAYIEFLAHFHGTRDYFECHEVLEEHWNEVDSRNQSSIWVWLIQIAVAMYHDRRGNQAGAKTLVQRCLKKKIEHEKELPLLGLDGERLEKQLEEFKTRLDTEVPYRSWNLPIIDMELLKEVQQLCQQWGVAYGSPSDLSDENLVFKHKRRKKSF
ncbi:DUF309 domain-containing protein [Halobacillus litoralis]|uniref:DUF309 domain-containing protein n=1 Tax=Halobacillus litoralis TaxID=45668 RepID=UPI00273E939C|nr:DUF309 domain-containing protein [Halobacillus litoralis]WLR46695.1 DUF309 domain-containing protein [Halobacillus litoralis]